MMLLRPSIILTTKLIRFSQHSVSLKMSTYEYPRLQRSEMIPLIAESGIASISESDIVSPKPDFVFDIFTKLLLYIDPTNRDDDGQVEFGALEQLGNPDHHLESARRMNLYIKIKEMLSAIHCPFSFNLNDLLSPDGKRTEFFLSSLLNFCLHKDAKIALMRPIVENLSALDDEGKELEARIFQLDSEVAEHNEAREREIPFIQELDSRVKELQQTIPKLNSEQMSLRTTCRKMKDKLTEKNEKISDAEFLLVQSHHENANLRAKIVQSPDKLQKALEEKKSALAEAKNAERLAMQSFQDKTTVLEVYTKALKKISKHSAQIQAIHEQLNSAKSIEKDVKALKTKIGDEEVFGKSIEVKLVEMQRKAEQLEESRKQLEQERDMKCDEGTKELNIVKKEVESRMHKLAMREKNVQALILETDTITSKINATKEVAALKRQELLLKCENLMKEFRQHSSSLDACCQNMQVRSS